MKEDQSENLKKLTFKESCLEWLDDVSKFLLKTKIKGKHPVVAGIIVLIILVLLGFAIASYYKKSSSPYAEKSAGVGEAISNVTIGSNNPKIENGFSCSFENGTWVKWFGTANPNMDHKNYFILPNDSNGFLFKYVSSDIDLSSCEYVFMPRGEAVVNYVISLDDVYQIVIGDNDSRTITFKTKNNLNDDYAIVKEGGSQKNRPRLGYEINQGTPVRVRVENKRIKDNSYSIVVTVQYKTGSTTLETKSENFVWNFDTVPEIYERSSLSVGLIRGKGDVANISADFIYPDISR